MSETFRKKGGGGVGVGWGWVGYRDRSHPLWHTRSDGKETGKPSFQAQRASGWVILPALLTATLALPGTFLSFLFFFSFSSSSSSSFFLNVWGGS